MDSLRKNLEVVSTDLLTGRPRLVFLLTFDLDLSVFCKRALSKKVKNMEYAGK